MRSLIIAAAAFVASASAQYLNQSAPFNLVLLSDNSTINGTLLSSCHEGAAIEGLCLGGSPTSTSSQYTFNTSTDASPNADGLYTGYLTWELHGGNFNLSSPMTLSINPTSNVAVPLLTPSESGDSITFDADNKLAIYGYLDDTQPLPNYEAKPYYNWYACTTYSGYLYQTLAWVVGNGVNAPQNPTCQKVEVVRVFV